MTFKFACHVIISSKVACPFLDIFFEQSNLYNIWSVIKDLRGQRYVSHVGNCSSIYP